MNPFSEFLKRQKDSINEEIRTSWNSNVRLVDLQKAFEDGDVDKKLILSELRMSFDPLVKEEDVLPFINMFYEDIRLEYTSACKKTKSKFDQPKITTKKIIDLIRYKCK